MRPCKCVTPVHIQCFSKWYDQSKPKCEICGDPFSRINEPKFHGSISWGSIETKIFFPFDDYYPVPLMTSHDIRRVEGNERFIHALCYLQCERMKDLLQNEETPPILGHMLTYFREGSMPSNYLKSYNQEAYAEMETILREYKVLN